MKPCKTVHSAISVRLKIFKTRSRSRLPPCTHTEKNKNYFNFNARRRAVCAAPYTHRAATYRAQPVRHYAALSASCTALHGACPLRVWRRAHRTTPCIKIKIVLFFLNAAQIFPVSVRCCLQCARRGTCTVDTVHAPCIKRRKCKPTCTQK